MRELSLNEIGMVGGGVNPLLTRANQVIGVVKDFVKGSPTTSSAVAGAGTNTAYYLHNDSNPTLGGMAKSGATGAIGGTVASKVPNRILGGAIGLGITGFLDKVTTGTNKTGDDYLRVD